jgi:ABC-2 type transport system ATP-binding protein
VERICDSLVAIDGGRLLRSAHLSAMTTATDVLAVEVSEGMAELARRLAELGMQARQDGRLLLVALESDATYDRILAVVAELDLPLHRLDQRRHHVAELFRAPTEAAHVR